jgi:tetratricopeptide (TPR) repeat protein
VQSRADAETLARAADYFVLCGRVPRAAELYQSALDERANLEGVKEKLAACLLETGNTAGAVAVIEKIVKANPLDLRAYDQLAQLHLKTGDMTRALANLRQALLIAPPDPRRFEDAIHLALAAHDSKAALDLAEEASEKFPKNIEFSLYRGLALSQQDRHEEAMKAFEFTLVEAGNSRPDLLDADFYFGYGVAAEQAGRTVKASELFLKSIELDPRRAARACNYLGYMWADRNENLDEAEKLIRRALELEPDNGAYVDSLGWVLFRKGQYDAALAELLRAAELLQDPDAVVFEHIGDTYEKLGRTAEAVLYWQKALQIAPGTDSLTKKVDANSSRIVQKPAEPAR